MLPTLTFYKCLADETRLNALLLIHKHSELCVCELQDVLKVSQPMVSRHLAELRRCGLVTSERRGKWVYYQLNQNLPNWTLAVLSKTPIPEYLDEPYGSIELTTQSRCE